MSESGKSDRWNSLLETLGVAPPEAKQPEPAPLAAEHPPATPLIEQPRAISMLRPEKAKPAAKPKPASKPPAKSASYWSRIAGALGLEAPATAEETAEPIAPESAAAPAREEAHTAETAPIQEREPEPVREPREEFGRRGGRPDRGSRGPDRERREERGPRRRAFGEERPFGEEAESPRAGRGVGFGQSAELDLPDRHEDDEAPTMREPGIPRQREADESGSVLDYEAPVGEGSDLAFGEEPGPSAAGDEEGQEAGERRRRRRRRGRGRRGSGEAPQAERTSRHEEDIEPAGEDVDFDFDRDEVPEADIEVSSERETRQRPRRGGQRPGRSGDEERYPPPSARSREGETERGGRTRRHEERPARGESRQPGSYEGEQASHEYSRRPPRTPAPPREEEIDLDLGDEHDDEHGGNVPTHKKIPTWEEAVNVLIDANMATRTNSDRDRDRGRGRGRGRR